MSETVINSHADSEEDAVWTHWRVTRNSLLESDSTSHRIESDGFPGDRDGRSREIGESKYLGQSERHSRSCQ